MKKPVVLLGDSIIDNAAYVPGGRPAVIDQVRDCLPQGWRSTLLARDGSVINDLHQKLASLPDDASHVVQSAGGNDALVQAGILGTPAGSVGQGIRVLAEIRDRFEDDYRRLTQAICRVVLEHDFGRKETVVFP